MEDVTRRFKKPCIADIKVGSRRLDPENPPPPGTKRKYHTVWEMGYQIQGLRVRNCTFKSEARLWLRLASTALIFYNCMKFGLL